MIEARELTKAFGTTLAVDRLTFDLTPGKVTGFLGPNGAGKSTTMRLIVGLDHPSDGDVTVDGRRYRDLPAPMREVGVLLEAKGVDPKRPAGRHLEWLALAGGIERRRVDEVLGLVGLTDVAGKPAGDFSLGMSQRLGLATALLGDPPVLLLDEPVNGLDPEGMRWVRRLLRSLADEGRTVVVSSHLMSEMEAVADHVLVIGRGRIVADTTMGELTSDGGAGAATRIVTPHLDRLIPLIEQTGATVVSSDDGAATATGIDNVSVAQLALEHQILLHEITPLRASLEDVFLELTHDSVEYRDNQEAAS